MNESLAYYLVVNALESRAGWTPTTRFATSISGVINGHLPYSRYNRAGCAAKMNGSGEGVIERLANDWLATDLNPLSNLIKGMRHWSSALRAYAAYNATVKVGVRTSVEAFAPARPDNPRPVVTRVLRENLGDPEPCRICTLATVDSVLKMVNRNSIAGRTQEVSRLSDVAQYLGIEGSAAGEAALVFESEGYVQIRRVAQRLGCHQRTLERQLRREGTMAETIRQACRLLRASNRLRSTESLTIIAADEGFADLPHMTRAFKTSFAMAPSVVRRLLLDDESERRSPSDLK